MADPAYCQGDNIEFMNPTSTDTGRIAEDKALAYLNIQGLVPIARNYRSPRGEIDLIMLDRDTTVFVEVRSRKNDRFLKVIETIDQRKKNNIILTSQHYIQNAEKSGTQFYRYDIVTLSGPMDRLNIDWIKNAFDA